MLTQWLSDLGQDVQIAVRTLRRRPVVAIVPVLSSALGISACSLVVGIANMALFRPLPVADSERLMSVSAQNLKTHEAASAMSYPEYRDLAPARSLEGVAAYFPMLPGALSAAGESFGEVSVELHGWLDIEGLESDGDDSDPFEDSLPGAWPFRLVSVPFPWP